MPQPNPLLTERRFCVILWHCIKPQITQNAEDVHESCRDRIDAFTIVIDEVHQLGTFIEIELMASNLDTLAATKKEMEALLSGLSLKPLTTGYDTLILREHHFNDYIQARFIMDEDKHLRSFQ